MKRVLLIALILALAACATSQIGPTPYLQSSDSLWASMIGSSTFYLEDFEDGSLNTPGVSASGNVRGPSVLTDSVDGDDGVIDGFGRLGHSFLGRAQGTVFTFGSGTYGALPTHAGLVWTDGNFGSTIRFEAFDANGVSLGSISGAHADFEETGETPEDRFYGWVHAGGIKRILIGNSQGSDIEIDHLQYGAVPEPATLVALCLGSIALASRHRKKRT